jgi:hypothetical protein
LDSNTTDLGVPGSYAHHLVLSVSCPKGPYKRNPLSEVLQAMNKQGGMTATMPHNSFQEFRKSPSKI